MECGVNPVLVFLSRIIYSLCGDFFLLKNFSHDFSFVARVIKRLFLEINIVLISFCMFLFALENPLFKVRRFFKLNTFFLNEALFSTISKFCL